MARAGGERGPQHLGQLGIRGGEESEAVGALERLVRHGTLRERTPASRPRERAGNVGQRGRHGALP